MKMRGKRSVKPHRSMLDDKVAQLQQSEVNSSRWEAARNETAKANADLKQEARENEQRWRQLYMWSVSRVRDAKKFVQPTHSEFPLEYPSTVKDINTIWPHTDRYNAIMNP